MKLYPILLLSCLLLASCKKEDEPVTPAVKNNTWKLGGTTYTVNNYVKANEGFQAHDKAGNALYFSFAAFPIVDGTYNVVGRTSTLGTNDMNVTAAGPVAGNSYFSSGYDGVKASIKVLSPTLLRISMPDTWVVKGGTDSLRLSVDIGSL